MILKVNDGYSPGHISMFYGNGMTVLGTLIPEVPKVGDYMAEFTVNGDWRFTLRSLPNAAKYQLYTNPEDITPALEAAIKYTCDGDTVKLNGKEWSIEWAFNNWFEVFTYRFDGDVWQATNDGEVWDGDFGPTLQEMEAVLVRHRFF